VAVERRQRVSREETSPVCVEYSRHPAGRCQPGGSVGILHERPVRGDFMAERRVEPSGRLDLAEPTTYDVVLPAGGRISGDFARSAGTTIKALIEIDGETILRRMIRVLAETGAARRTIVIGPDEALDEARAAGADMVLGEGDSGPENVFRGLEASVAQRAGGDHRVVIAASDLPFLTAAAVEAFVRAAPDVDIAVPVVRKEDFERAYPKTTSTYVSLREGEITMGCLFLLRPEALLRNRVHLERAFAARKSNLAMAQLIGLPAVIAFALRRLSLDRIEERCRNVLRCSGSAVIGSPAESAFDIDDIADLDYARAHMLSTTG
jgi:CTP:molybdopterin cytidylyltransferase MocA